MTMRNLRAALLLAIAVVYMGATGAPIIGVNIDAAGDDYHGRLNLSSDYIDAVTSAGGIPIILPLVTDHDAVQRYVEMCDGFLFTGGRDISPARYGAEEVHETVRLLNPRRENFDFAMIEAVLAANKPMLGVCLGSQEINVALGGSMIQDLPSQTSSTINHKPGERGFNHSVDITTGTKLHDIAGTTTLQVNSIHHQACDALGRGVLVSARAPDGVVEAYEVNGHDFVMGIQWHPEDLVSSGPEHLAIYKALVNAAQEQMLKREAVPAGL